MGRARQSLFEQLERSFGLLTSGSAPLSAAGRAIGHDLPERAIPLDELRRLLLSESTSYQARDAALRWLVTRARAEGDAATIGLVGMLLPGLRNASRWVLDACSEHAEDLEAEILTGLVAAIRHIDLKDDRLAKRIISSAVDAGRQALDRLIAQERHEFLVEKLDEELVPLPRPSAVMDGGNPHWLLEEAVAAGAISDAEAKLIGEHRINDIPLEELTERMEVGMAAIFKRRQRAERALRAWLADRSSGHTERPQPGQGRSITGDVLDSAWSSPFQDSGLHGLTT